MITNVTYYFKFEDGRVALNADIEPTWLTGDEVFTMGHPRHVARILAEHPELPIGQIVALTEHFDSIEGIQVSPYTCGCDHCAEEHAAEQAAEIAAETNIPQWMVW